MEKTRSQRTLIAPVPLGFPFGRDQKWRHFAENLLKRLQRACSGLVPEYRTSQQLNTFLIRPTHNKHISSTCSTTCPPH